MDQIDITDCNNILNGTKVGVDLVEILNKISTLNF